MKTFISVYLFGALPYIHVEKQQADGKVCLRPEKQP